MGYSGWGLGWFKRKRAREGDPDTGGPRSGGNLGSAGGSPRAGAEPATRQHKRPAEKKVSFQAEGRTTRATQHQPALPEGKSSKPPGQKRPHKQRGEQAVSGAPGSSETAESPKGWRSSTRHRGEQQQQEEENEGSKQDKPAASKKTRLASNAKSQQPRTRARQNAVAGQAASQRPSEQIGQQQQRRPRTLAVLPSEQQQQDQKPQKAEAKPSGRGRTPARGTAADDGLPGPSNRLAEPVVEPPAAGGNEPAKPTGMKRVRSSWKMRPLFTDEKLRVFVEGRDDELALYDDGEFYRWLTDCEAGKANPEDGFCYPLVVQDQDMRTVLEIKPLAAAKPAAGQAEAEGKGTAAKPRREDAIGHLAAEGPIRVPLIRVLPQEQQPDMMLEAELVAAEQAQAASKAQDSPSPEDAGGPGSSRPGSGPLPSVRRAGATAAVDGAGAQSDEDEGAGDADPPYVRYLEPTPDDLDLQVEYDLDEEDEEWLEAFNERARKGKSRKARLRLNEDWMERLMDRMEKEYTHALQRHPEKWVIQQQPDGSSSDMPSITLPRIEEVFSLQDCLQAPGMHHYPSILEAVYNYWKGKHTRAGSPLIQRLWYEPPWHRKKAAERVAEEEAGEGGPFLALDPLEQLQGVRRRKLDTEEIRSRFSELRRDLDAARLLADQVRRREKLKKQELRIFQQEWAARLAEIEAGQPVTLRNGELRYPPPTLSTLGRLRAAGGEDTLAVGAPGEQEGPAEAAVEDRAARLAARREARLAVVAAGDKRKRPSEADQAGRKGQNPAPLRKEKLQKGKEQERAPSPHASGNTASEVAGDAADATTSSPERRGRKARQQQLQPLQKQTMGPSTAHNNQQRLRQQLQQEEEEAMQNAAHLRQRNRGNVEDAVDVAAGLGKPAAAGQSRREQAGGGRNHGKPSRAAAAALGQRRHDDGRAGTGKHAAAARPQGRQAGDDGRHSKPSRGAAVEQLPKPAPARSTKKRRRQQAHPAPAQETVNGVEDPASEVDSDVTHKENQAPARPPKRTRAAAPSPPRKPSHHAQQQQAQHGSRRAPAATRRPAAASPLSREVLALLKQTIPDFAQGLRR